MLFVELHQPHQIGTGDRWFETDRIAVEGPAKTVRIVAFAKVNAVMEIEMTMRTGAIIKLLDCWSRGVALLVALMLGRRVAKLRVS